MVEVLANLLGISTSTKPDSLIKQVTEASIAGVCEDVAAEIDTMSLSEARGYIRARAARVVRKQTRLAISRQAKPHSICSHSVARAATERLIPTVLREMKVGVPRTLVAQPEPLRMAA